MTPTPNPSSNLPMYRNEVSGRAEQTSTAIKADVVICEAMSGNKLTHVAPYFCDGDCKPAHDVRNRRNHQ